MLDGKSFESYAAREIGFIALSFVILGAVLGGSAVALLIWIF